MGTQLTKIYQQLELLFNKLPKAFICQLLIVILFTSFMVSCSKDNPEPEIEIQQIDPKDDDDETPPPPPPPPPVSQSDIDQVDSAVSAFLSKYSVPGAAVAVSVNEKMVYTKGYGLANVENNTPTKADDVFRIASISKPFTATGILKLVDEGKLELTDKVFGPEGILGDDFGTATLTADELEITVDHLLIHAGGGWSVATGGDPIDYEPQLEGNDYIEYVLNNWDLASTPGTSFAYSNMGYYLLARIVEKVSEQPFENYIRELVTPTGITSFKTTTFRQDDREANEVEYYGTTQEMQWIYTIASRRDGDGGVVISAPDVLRFICAIDGKTNRPDIVSANSQDLMSQPSALSSLGRGLGTWQEQNMLFFTGSLPGTRTWLYMEQERGVYAVLLLNSRGEQTDFDNDLNTLVYNMVKDTSIPWQTDLDQF